MARDLNGHAVDRGRVRLILDRLRPGRDTSAEPEPGEAGLEIVAQSYDDAAASSAVLQDSAWRGEEQAVVSHVLAIPPDRIAAVSATAAQDHYVCTDLDGPPPGLTVDAIPDAAVLVALSRTQLLDALHLPAQHGGTVLGWQVLQRPAGD